MSETSLLTSVQAYAPDFARRFGIIMAALAALIARRCPREPCLAAFVLPLWARLTRAARRFERLMARVAAGKPSKPRRPGAPTSGSSRPGGPHRSADTLPTGRAWLVIVLGYEAAGYASQLAALLAEPGAAELLALAPSAGRILRPISRMLGIGAYAPRPRPARAAPVPKPTNEEFVLFDEVAFRSQGYT